MGLWSSPATPSSLAAALVQTELGPGAGIPADPNSAHGTRVTQMFSMGWHSTHIHSAEPSPHPAPIGRGPAQQIGFILSWIKGTVSQG